MLVRHLWCWWHHNSELSEPGQFSEPLLSPLLIVFFLKQAGVPNRFQLTLILPPIPFTEQVKPLPRKFSTNQGLEHRPQISWPPSHLMSEANNPDMVMTVYLQWRSSVTVQGRSCWPPGWRCWRRCSRTCRGTRWSRRQSRSSPGQTCKAWCSLKKLILFFVVLLTLSSLCPLF